jgi:hypothetical protein
MIIFFKTGMEKSESEKELTGILNIRIVERISEKQKEIPMFKDILKLFKFLSLVVFFEILLFVYRIFGKHKEISEDDEISFFWEE